MNSPENPYRQMDETVVNTESVKESLDILKDQLLHVATLQAIESYIIKRTDIELLGDNAVIDAFEIQQDISEGKTKLDSAVAKALDVMGIVFLEHLTDRLDNLQPEN
jgi:hypothetical protein